MRRVFIIAAMDFEVRALTRAVSRGNGTDYRVVAAGPGFRAARKAIESLDGVPDMVVSAGICGGLSPAIGLYDVVAATSVNGFTCHLPASPRAFQRGPLKSVDRVASTPEERKQLAADGSVVVDMEAAVIAEYAQRMGVPICCVKAVSDTCDEGFTLDLNRARDGEGRFRTTAIVGQALRTPWQGLPELLRLRQRALEASRRLGEFFADCDI